MKTLGRNKLVAYAFLAPWLVGLFTLTLIPMIASLYLSLTNYDFSRTTSFVGLQNYIRLFTIDGRYRQSLNVTFTYVFLGVPLRLIAALAVALLMQRVSRIHRVYRAVYYIPSLLGASVAVAILWRKILGSNGLVNLLLVKLGIAGAAGVSWITQPSTALMSLVALAVWQYGSSMIIFLAGLRQIPRTLYESAMIDGAGAPSRFFRITMPLLSPIVLFNTVMAIIGTFKTFTPAFVVSGGTGGTLDSVLFYTLYLYIESFTNFQMGYGSAIAWVLLAIISVFTGLILLSSTKWVYYEK